MAAAEPVTESAISAHGLVRRFGRLTAVDHVDLEVPHAAIYGFLGPNGSGKSTTLRMLCGLLVPTEGTIRVLGHEVPREAEALRQRIGYMTQKFSLWDDLSVRENLEFLSQLFALGKAAARRRIDALAAEYRLAEILERPAGQLSGGQRQRLALAAATLHEPELLMLDEPTSAVDPQSRRDFWESLFALAARGTTILVSTHYMDEAERCHGLAIMNLGRVVARGSPEQLMDEIPWQVVEVAAPDPQAARAACQHLPGLRSIAQLGLKLHLLLERSVEDGAASVRAALSAQAVAGEVAQTRANLEDVFVAATQAAGGERT